MKEDALDPVIHAPARLRKLEDAGYVSTEKNGAGVTARTSVALTYDGRAALERYATTLRQLLDSASQPPVPGARPGTVKREP
jgi:DNA-binding PadR family transcriptional regulator